METLTRKQLLDLAPGASPREDEDSRLFDTWRWVEAYGAFGFAPVMAMQGTTHADAKQDPKNGRHLVVLAHESTGLAVSLLNSHDRLMRIYEGYGLWDGSDMIMSCATPLKRWKYIASYNVAAMEAIVVDKDIMLVKTGRRREQAAYVAKHGYIGGRGRPSASGLYEAISEPYKMSALETSFALVAAARKGNLEPSTNATTRRNIKGIRRPDAYQHVALAAYKAAMELCR